MPPRQTRDLQTLIVIGCAAAARPDGRVSIRFETQELGPIAIEVSEQSIAWLRGALSAAETHLRQSKNQTRN